MLTFKNVNVYLFGYSPLTDILKFYCAALYRIFEHYLEFIYNVFQNNFRNEKIHVNVIKNLQNYLSMEILMN